MTYTIQIPVYKETRALAFSAFYFARLGVEVRYLLDSKCSAEASETLRRLGREAVYFSNDKPFIENGYENFAAASPTDWILRLDCDEVPSPELLAACDDFVQRDGAGIAGFERHQVLWRDGRLLTATAQPLAPAAQRQWRLFNRTRVRFDARLHTPGVHLDDPDEQASEAAIYHLSWIFLTREERLRKSARYDAHGQPAANRSNQLFPLEDAGWAPLNAPFLRDALLHGLPG